MNVTIDQTCPSCGTGIHESPEITEITASALLRTLTINWACPACEATYETEATIDMDIVDSFGFESWIGSVNNATACVLVEAGNDSDSETGAEFVTDKSA